MSHIEMFLWVAFPSLSIVALELRVGWTTHSSQIFESSLLRLS